MLKLLVRLSIVLSCFDVISAAVKPASVMRNSLGDFEAAETRISEAVVGKLGEIAEVIREGNHATLEVSSASNVEMLRLVRTQEARLFELESKLNKITQDCQGDAQREVNQDRELISIRKRLQALEEILNETKTDNDELKETISKLQNSEVVRVETETSFKSNETETRFNFNETETLLQRIPRNFLSSSPEIVAFDAYRNKPFHTAQSYVTFDGTNVNAGNGFDASTGVFKAPRSGLYNFAFHALTQDGRATYVKIVHNGKNVGGAYRRHEGEGDESHEANINSPVLRRAEGMLAQSVILELSKGDQVQVFAYHGNLRDGGWHYTHFNGFLIQ